MTDPIPEPMKDSLSSGSDARIFQIVEKLLAEKRSGDEPSLEQVAKDHPDLIEEVKELWKVANLAEEFGSFSGIQESRSDSKGDLLCVEKSNEQILSDKGMDDYELLEEIGRGGMGVIYRARQKSLNRIVALKMVLRGLTASSSDLTRFRAEAESAARLKHPNVVPVYEVGEFDGLPFFSMQYIEGTTLAKKLANRPMKGHESTKLLLPVVEAIAEAHQQGILHRDLKPSNILIDKNGRAFVTDFGLAKRIVPDSDDEPEKNYQEFVTQTGAIIGTPSYMSPEQAAGSRGVIGPASDIYSLGAILYTTLTGRPPFQAASSFDTVLMVLEQDPIPPRVLNPQADRDLEMIAMKCLQKPVDLRYNSANELAADLKSYLANEPIEARSSHFTQIFSRLFQESHHAPILENWGLLLMLHSGVLLVLCLVTNGLQLSGVSDRWPYLMLWTLGMGTWAVIFWNLRHRAGPTTFVERQIAHVWAGSMIIDTMLYVIEYQLQFPVLTLSPILGPVGGIVFLMKASMLSGWFYIHAMALFLTGIAMAWLQQQSLIPNLGITLFGVVSSLCFFLPGLKYYRQSKKSAK